jgi:hypothetical protein
MTTNIRVVRKIVVNGVEYHSVDELPPDLRAKYETAIAGQLHSGGLTVNGQHFDSIDAVPPEVRNMVGEAVGTAPNTSRLVTTLVIVIAVLAGVIAFLLRAR